MHIGGTAYHIGDSVQNLMVGKYGDKGNKAQKKFQKEALNAAMIH